MSKQEVKDEYKQSEGDPIIKQRLRRLRMERAQNRMMAEVPKSDVVITNPTHFAVALKYDTKTMSAPIVVAKGQDLIALKIREIAKENDVPVIENPPLARALFASTELEKEIPVTHYEAVAKIISYVYQLKGKKP
jgi:flagellar biosynthetic protein FlhB